MAVTGTVTLIPLQRMATHLGIDPYHFNQIYTSQRPSGILSCDDMWLQYDWQSAGRLSRESLATALRQAEDMVIEYLGWWPLPTWIEEEHPVPQHYKTEMLSFRNAQGEAKSVTVNSKYLIEVGRKASTFIATPAVAFSDVDGDGYAETTTILFATTVTNKEELRVFYPGHAGRAEWEIRPLTSIVIAGGLATIEFPRYLIPLFNLQARAPLDGDPHVGIDGDDVANFLTTVDVYRVYTDTTQQGTLYYEAASGCSGDGCVNATDSLCLTVRNKRLGIVAFNRADYVNGQWVAGNYTGLPLKLDVYYKAGMQDSRQEFPNLNMNPSLERMISFYALTLLDTELAGCDNTRKIWQKMTRDLSMRTGDVSYTVAWGDVGNPFGATFAGLSLWKYLDQIQAKS